MTKTPSKVFVYESGPSVERPERAEGLVALSWDGNQVNISETSPIIGLDPNVVCDDLVHVLRAAARTQKIMQSLLRWEAADLQVRGLVRRHAEGYLGSSLLDGVFSDSPHAWVHFEQEKVVGWFLPDADPTVFGTPYLKERAVSYSSSLPAEGWTLAYVGTNVGVMEVAWDDLDGISDLIAQMATMDPEYVETVAVLSDSERFERDLRRYEQQQATDAARKAFPVSKRIKPRLSEKAVLNAFRRASTQHVAQYDERIPLNVTVRNVDLRSLRHRSEYFAPEKPIHAALRVETSVPYYAKSSSVDDQAKARDIIENTLVETIKFQKLGTLIRLERGDGTPANTYFIVKDVDRALQHRRALGIDRNLTPVVVG